MSNTQEVVNEEVTTPEVSEDLQTQIMDNAVIEETAEPLKAGDKTEPNLLLKSLQAERELRKAEQEARKQLEEEIQSLRSSLQSDEEVVSDEGKALAKRIAQLEQDKARETVVTTYPVLKDKWAEFETFRLNPENAGMSIQTAAKAYLIDNGYFDKRRTGAEAPTGGTREPSTTSMSSEDVANLRKNNPRKYSDMIAKGQIKV